MKKHFIFILPNIYDHTSGVSNKYISFINYLSYKTSSYTHNITICNVSKNITPLNNVSYYKCSSISLPLYNAIYIPIISESHLKNIIYNDYSNIIIFNSEFIWLHNTLINIKKNNNNVSLIPTIHTNIDLYLKDYLKSLPTNIFNYTFNYNFELSSFIDKNLLNNNFDKILVTGNVLENKYLNLIENNKVLNVNEIDYDKFIIYHKSMIQRRDYIHKNGAFINVIYCGRISIEKNILYNFETIDFLVKFYLNNDYSKVNFHIIGTGPYLDTLKKECETKYNNLFKRTTFYGNQKHDFIGNFYKNIYNPIFIFSSKSETFGKTAVEASICGIPAFVIDYDTSSLLFKDKFNAFIFKDKMDFVKKFDYYMKLSFNELYVFDKNVQEFVKSYDQKIVFRKWYDFINNS